jgi:hypothetical protein
MATYPGLFLRHREEEVANSRIAVCARGRVAEKEWMCRETRGGFLSHLDRGFEFEVLFRPAG